jgi:hypothetical protein
MDDVDYPSDGQEEPPAQRSSKKATPAAPESSPEDSEPHKPAAIANKQAITVKKPKKYRLPLPANSDANSDSDLQPPPPKKKKSSKKGKGKRVKFDLAQELMDVDHEEERMDEDNQEVPETPQASPPVSALKKGKAKATVGPKVKTLELGKGQAIPHGMVAYDDEEALREGLKRSMQIVTHGDAGTLGIHLMRLPSHLVFTGPSGTRRETPTPPPEQTSKCLQIPGNGCQLLMKFIFNRTVQCVKR